MATPPDLPPIGGLPPMGGPSAPPMVNALPDMDSVSFGKEIQQQFLSGVLEGIRTETEQMAFATGEIEFNFSGLAEASAMMLDEAEAAVREVRSLRISEDAQRQALVQMEQYGLTPEVIASAITVLSERTGTDPQALRTALNRVESDAEALVEGVAQGVTKGLEGSAGLRADVDSDKIAGAVRDGMGSGAAQRLPSTADQQAEPLQRSYPMGDSRQPSLFGDGSRGGSEQPSLFGDFEDPFQQAQDAIQPHPYADVMDRGDVDRVSAGRFGEGAMAGGAAGRLPSTADSAPMTWQEGMRTGGNLDSLRGAAAGRINRWASERMGEGRPEMLPHVPGMQDAWVDPEAGAAWERNQNRLGQVTGVMDAIGDGKGLTGAISSLSSTVARVLGPIGMAVGGAQMIGSTMSSQRAENLPYQQAFGGGQMDAYGQRIEEGMFSRLGAFGTLSQGEASRLFRNVSSLGQEGDERERSLDFALNMYRDGVGLDTSMELITMAATEGQDVLGDYGAALEALSETAQEAGVAVSEAHRLYMNALRETQGITTGEAAGDLATAIAAIQTQQSATPLGEIDYFSLTQDENLMTRTAQSLGETYPEFSARLQSGDESALDALTQESIGRVAAEAPNYQRLTPESEAQIQQIWQNSGGSLSGEDANEIANIMTADGVIDMRNIERYRKELGAPRMDQTQWNQWIARAYVGDPRVDVGGMAEAAIESKSDIRETTWDDGSELSGGSNVISRLFGGRVSAGAAAQEAWGWRNKDNYFMHTSGGDFDADNVQDAGDAYLDYLQHTDGAQRSDQYESVLSEIGRREDESEEDWQARVGEWDQREFEVLDESGEVVRTFGMADLYDNISELETGRVRIASDTDVPGAMLQEGLFTPRERVEAGAFGDPTQWITDQIRDAIGGRDMSNVNVTIEAKGELEEFLNIKHDGGLDVKTARETGHAPSGFPRGPSGQFYTGNG